MNAPEIMIDDLVREIFQRTGENRILLGIAGPPGVGKSTFCDRLCGKLNTADGEIAAVFPMDGFHYDDIYLEQKGWKARKGAPHTFDVGGFCHTLGRLKKNEEDFVAVPVFDRSLEIARAGARVIAQDIRIILVEGNYLLLDEEPWRQVRQYFDISVMLTAELAVLEQRLGARWGDLQMSPDEIAQKLGGNDLPNVHTVVNSSSRADFVVRTN